MDPFQHTIKKNVTCTGIGLHSGKTVTLCIKPAPVNSGISFRRTDLKQTPLMPALMDRVVDTRLATTIAEGEVSVATAEHLLASICGLGIDNAVIEIDNSEVPIMDGSADPFLRALRKTGTRAQASYRRILKITREISYTDEDRTIRIIPFDGFRINATIDFRHSLIKRQTYDFELSLQRFAEEIAPARTFGFSDEIEWLRQNGLALGGSLENAVVVGPTGILNKEGLRFKNEFVRHKILDIIGDLALLGCPVLGHVIATKSGHSQHLALMQEIVAHPESWEYVELDGDGRHTVLKKMTTRSADSRFLPFLLAQGSPALSEMPCAAC